MNSNNKMINWYKLHELSQNAKKEIFCENHLWINTGLKIQGKSIKMCVRCRETKTYSYKF